MTAGTLEPICAEIARLAAMREFAGAASRLAQFRTDLDESLSRPGTDTRRVLSTAQSHIDALLERIRMIRTEMHFEARSLVCVSRYLEAESACPRGGTHSEIG